MELQLAKHNSRNPWARYGVAVATPFLALLVRLPFASVLESKVPFITFFLATAISASFGGLGPGLVATILGAYLAAAYIIPPVGSVIFVDPLDYWALAIFLGVSGFISYICGRLLDSRVHEHALRQLFRQTLLSIGDAVISTDCDQQIRFMNRAAEDLTGWREQEAKGKPLSEVFRIVKEGSDTPAEIPVELVLAKGTVAGLANHTELITRDQRRIPIDDSASPIKADDGKIAGAVLVFRDITERRRTELALKEREEQLTVFIESAPAGLAMFDSEMHYIAVSRRFVEDFRLPADVIGKSHYELFPNLSDEWKQVHQRALNGSVERSENDLFLHSDGEREWLRWEVRPWRTADGHVGGIVIASELLTPQREAEQALFESQQRFQEVAEIAPQFIWVSKSDGTVEYVNKRWREYSGLDLNATADHQRLRLTVHPEDREQMFSKWSEAQQVGGELETEARLLSAQGEYRWFLIRTVPIKDPSGRVLRWIGSSTDITDQKTVQADLTRMNKELEEFAFVASHDLQEPLRMVNIYTQLLTRQHVGDDSQAKEYAAIIHSGVNRMEALIRDLLAFSRSVFSEEALTETADLSESLSQAMLVLKDRIAESGAMIVAPALPKVKGDTAQFTQVFQNLVSNALKYRQNGKTPHIQIAVSSDRNNWTISVSDNGIGFDNRYAERIFGLFKRLHKDEFPGTGLGLAICQRIIERYHGRIWAESKLGEGSTFSFSLPHSRDEVK